MPNTKKMTAKTDKQFSMNEWNLNYSSSSKCYYIEWRKWWLWSWESGLAATLSWSAAWTHARKLSYLLSKALTSRLTKDSNLVGIWFSLLYYCKLLKSKSTEIHKRNIHFFVKNIEVQLDNKNLQVEKTKWALSIEIKKVTLKDNFF